MFLAINLNAANAKKRKKEEERAAKKQKNNQAVDAIKETIEMAANTKNNVHNLNKDNTLTEYVVKGKCMKCQHPLIVNDQKVNRRIVCGDDNMPLSDNSRVPLTIPACLCDCNCAYKEEVLSRHRDSTASIMTVSTTAANFDQITKHHSSLFSVYICLGTLAFAFATLAVLFYSHVTSSDCSASAVNIELDNHWTTLHSREFRALFQQELIASEQLLRDIVTQFIQTQNKQQSGQVNHTATSTETASSFQTSR